MTLLHCFPSRSRPKRTHGGIHQAFKDAVRQRGCAVLCSALLCSAVRPLTFFCVHLSFDFDPHVRDDAVQAPEMQRCVRMCCVGTDNSPHMHRTRTCLDTCTARPQSQRLTLVLLLIDPSLLAVRGTDAAACASQTLTSQSPSQSPGTWHGWPVWWWWW